MRARTLNVARVAVAAVAVGIAFVIGCAFAGLTSHREEVTKATLAPRPTR